MDEINNLLKKILNKVKRLNKDDVNLTIINDNLEIKNNLLILNLKCKADNILICEYNDGGIFEYKPEKKANVVNTQFVLPIKEFSLHELNRFYLKKGDIENNENNLLNEILNLRLNTKLLSDFSYLIENVFSPKCRIGQNNNKIFLSLYTLLQYMIKTNKYDYFGKILTVMCYRISDDMKNLDNFIDDAYELWRIYADNIKHNDGTMLRDLVSGSTTLTVLLLSIDRIEAADVITDRTTKIIVHPGVNIFNYYNYTLLLILKGMINLYKEDYDKAATCFIYSFKVGSGGIVEMLTKHINEVLEYKYDIEWTETLVCFDAYVLYHLRDRKNMLEPAGIRIRRLPTNHDMETNDKQIKAIFHRFKNIQKNTPLFFDIAMKNLLLHSDQYNK